METFSKLVNRAIVIIIRTTAGLFFIILHFHSDFLPFLAFFLSLIVIFVAAIVVFPPGTHVTHMVWTFGNNSPTGIQDLVVQICASLPVEGGLIRHTLVSHCAC